MVDRLLDGAPPGSSATCSDNGWINGPVFLEWLRHFVDNVRPTQEQNVIFVMDNHESHKYLGALEYASQNHVIFVSLAPHTTHRMQPLDTCVYGPLKTYFEQAVSVFQRTHVGRNISQYEVARLFSEAYMKAATPQNAVKGFSSTGIWPTNRNVFDDCDYMPSNLTDRPDPSGVPVDTEADLISHEPTSGPDGFGIPMDTEADLFSYESETNFDVTNVIETHTHEFRESPDSDRTVSPSVLDKIIESHYTCKTPTPIADDELVTQNRIGSLTTDTSNSKQTMNKDITAVSHVTPMDIRPSPKMEPNKTARRRNQCHLPETSRKFTEGCRSLDLDQVEIVASHLK
ncbi:hypothetical protein PYW07_006463 [Mythimna separata]|uniref:DDE-1 domain-containing protein n=1 Tax=Mythimna separata TaxID=271217 RepID=A0AAD7YWC2_MYTSE|nr:hypothetical protein PYW07_006463 [Mythimna separata]